MLLDHCPNYDKAPMLHVIVHTMIRCLCYMIIAHTLLKCYIICIIVHTMIRCLCYMIIPYHSADNDHVAKAPYHSVDSDHVHSYYNALS